VENVDPLQCGNFWTHEMSVEDVLLFRDLARSESGIGTLYQATGSCPERSARHREFLLPRGYDDELRACAGRILGHWLDLQLHDGHDQCPCSSP
jgi:hypothetical protein